MGMYTEVFFRAEVDDEAWNTLKRVHDTLDPYALTRLPDHEFFTRPRWPWVFTGSSYYFPGAQHFTFEDDAVARRRSVSFRADLKNYDGEIEAFFDWVAPHVKDSPGEFIGYSLYEEAAEPTIYHAPGA